MAISIGNRPGYLVVPYGIRIAGAVAVPTGARLHPNEAGWIVVDAGACTVFVTSARDAGSATPTVDASELAVARACDGEPAAPAPRASFGLALPVCTSGTTGRPEGVEIARGMPTAPSPGCLSDVIAVRPAGGALCAAPLGHGAGLRAPVHVLRAAPQLRPPPGGGDPREALGIAAAHGSFGAFLAATRVHRPARAAFDRPSGCSLAELRRRVWGRVR